MPLPANPSQQTAVQGTNVSAVINFISRRSPTQDQHRVIVRQQDRRENSRGGANWTPPLKIRQPPGQTLLLKPNPRNRYSLPLRGPCHPATLLLNAPRAAKSSPVPRKPYSSPDQTRRSSEGAPSVPSAGNQDAPVCQARRRQPHAGRGQSSCKTELPRRAIKDFYRCARRAAILAAGNQHSPILQ